MPMRSALQADVVSSISEFMAKPRISKTATWTTGAAAGSLLLSGTSWTETALDSVFANKIFGFSGLTYTTNIRVQVNASPFQQGRLRLSYYPNAVATPLKVVGHLGHRTSISQLPGIEMNVNDVSMEMRIPFTSFQEYLDVVNTANQVMDPVSWYLHVFSPLANGANATITTASLTVWIWYTDVKLFGASTVAIQSQSKRSGKGRAAVRHVSEQEEKPLSSWLSSSASLADSMSSIPILSGITGPTSWFLRHASGVASAFGYSRPANGEPVRPVAPHFHSALPNADGVTPASVLALAHDAKIRTLSEYSPSGQDEMSMNFIKRQWAYFDEFSWSSANAIGSQLYKHDLNLGFSNNLTTGVSMTPLTMLSNLFRFYRGGIEVMFKFVKTGFHAGSLAVSAQYGTVSGANLLLTDTDPLHRSVVDIQDGAEFCLSFPFICYSDYLETFELYGTFYVHVVNAIVAPETVPANVIVQMYVRGMEDLEFSTVADANVLSPIVAQGGQLEEDSEIVCEPVGGRLSNKTMSGLQTMDSMSESVSSLLQVLKYGSQLYNYVSAVPTSILTWDMYPFAVGTFTKTGVAPVVSPPYQAGAMNVIRSCFAYHRGSFELNLIANQGALPTQPTFTARSHISYGSPGPVFSGTADDYSNTFQTGTAKTITPHTAANSAQHGLSVLLPYRSRYRAAPVILMDRTGSLNETQSLNAFRYTVNPNDVVLLRAGDDYQCMFWVGVPILTTTGS